MTAFGFSLLKPDAFAPGTTAELGKGVRLSVIADGSNVLSGPRSFKRQRGQRIFYTDPTMRSLP